MVSRLRFEVFERSGYGRVAQPEVGVEIATCLFAWDCERCPYGQVLTADEARPRNDAAILAKILLLTCRT